MTQSQGIAFDIVQLILYLVITPVSIRLVVKTYVELTVYKNSQTFRIDFYIFHIIIYSAWAIFGLINVYYTLGNIVLRQLAGNSEQLEVLLGNGAHHCASDLFLVFSFAIYGYCAILMPINWMEIATNGYVAATDVSSYFKYFVRFYNPRKTRPNLNPPHHHYEVGTKPMMT